ncbi:MAG: protease inhibitor I42 family protein [Ginsengibacter sp.]
MATTTLSENNNQQHIEIAVSDIIQLQLDESPATGYRWEITELNTNDIQVISEDFKLKADVGIGGGGKKIIHLKVLRKATGSIKLENRRPWSKEIYKRFEVFYS